MYLYLLFSLISIVSNTYYPKSDKTGISKQQHTGETTKKREQKLGKHLSLMPGASEGFLYPVPEMTDMLILFTMTSDVFPLRVWRKNECTTRVDIV